MPDPPDKAAERRVQAALKATIETNLAREKAVADFVGRVPGVGYFSNGIIFSKTGNGTPFSNGIFFSKTGSHLVAKEEFDPAIVQDLIAFDEVAFNAFTDRLLRLKQTKGEAGSH